MRCSGYDGLFRLTAEAQAERGRVLAAESVNCIMSGVEAVTSPVSHDRHDRQRTSFNADEGYHQRR